MSFFGIPGIPPSEKGAPNGVAPLDEHGEVAAQYLPAIAITDTFTVNSEANQLLLDAQVGDVAIRTDESKSYILAAEPATVFSNWKELLTPTDQVQSVNGQTGTVILNVEDINDVSTREDLNPLDPPAYAGDLLIYDETNVVWQVSPFPEIGISTDAGGYWLVDVDHTNAPTADQVLAWNGTNNLWEPRTLEDGIAETVRTYVINKDTVQINKGDVVYLSGAQGDVAAVKLASNTSDTTSARTFGIANENIAVNGNGYVINQGEISGLSLGAYTTGDILWLDSTAGDFTATKPTAPNHTVFVGVVLRANAGDGILYVKPQNGYELDEIHDVKLTSPASGDYLRYDSSQGLWVNSADVNTIETGAVTLTGGVATVDFSACSAGKGISSTANVQHMHAIRPSKTMTVSQFSYIQTVAPSNPQIVLGLYTHNAATNVFTLVARTTSYVVGTSSGLITIPFDTSGGYPASYTLTGGTLYYIGFMSGSGTVTMLGPAAKNAGSGLTVAATVFSPPLMGTITNTNTGVLLTSYTGSTFPAAVTDAVNVWIRLS